MCRTYVKKKYILNICLEFVSERDAWGWGHHIDGGVILKLVTGFSGQGFFNVYCNETPGSILGKGLAECYSKC